MDYSYISRSSLFLVILTYLLIAEHSLASFNLTSEHFGNYQKTKEEFIIQIEQQGFRKEIVEFNDKKQTIHLNISPLQAGILFPKIFSSFPMIKSKVDHDKMVYLSHKEQQIEMERREKAGRRIPMHLYMGVDDPYNIWYEGLLNLRPEDLGLPPSTELYNESCQLMDQAVVIKEQPSQESEGIQIQGGEKIILGQIKTNLIQYDGVIIGEEHNRLSPKRFLIENVAKLKEAGVQTLYMEHLFQDDHQELLDLWLEQGGEIPSELKHYLNVLDTGNHLFDAYPDNFLGLVETYIKNGIRIVAIDKSMTYPRPGKNVDNFTKKRYNLMNIHAKQVIDKTQTENNHKKYIAFVGNGHLGFRQEGFGEDRQKIKGVDILMNVPSIVITERKILSPQIRQNVYKPSGNQADLVWIQAPSMTRDEERAEALRKVKFASLEALLAEQGKWSAEQLAELNQLVLETLGIDKFIQDQIDNKYSINKEEKLIQLLVTYQRENEDKFLNLLEAYYTRFPLSGNMEQKTLLISAISYMNKTKKLKEKIYLILRGYTNSSSNSNLKVFLAHQLYQMDPNYFTSDFNPNLHAINHDPAEPNMHKQLMSFLQDKEYKNFPKKMGLFTGSKDESVQLLDTTDAKKSKDDKKGKKRGFIYKIFHRS